MSKIEEILDEMDQLLEMSQENSGGLFSVFNQDKIKIDGERLNELIKSAKAALPQEIKKANTIIYEAKRIKGLAEEEREEIINNAQQRARKMVSEQEILTEAKKQAEQMIEQAMEQRRKIEIATNRYVEKILTTAELSLSESYKDIQRKKDKIIQSQTKPKNQEK